MSEIRNPHDRFFRETFSRLEIATDFIAEYLPPEVVAALDLDTLELEKDSFVDEELREHFSDLLYRVRQENGEEAHVYLLLEHKSSPDFQVAFQLLRYMVRIWERAQRNKIKPLPAIIPIVVYHGREEWQVSENFDGLFVGAESFRPYWPNFRYELQDLGRYDVSDVRGNSLLRTTLLALIRSFDPKLPDELVNILMPLAELADRNLAVEFLQVVVYYVSITTQDITPEKVSEAIDKAFEDDGETIMGSFVEELIEQGKKEGLKEGQQQGLQEGHQRGLRAAIIDLLMVRFDAGSANISGRLGNITDLESLRLLNRKAATADSVSEFEAYLETFE